MYTSIYNDPKYNLPIEKYDKDYFEFLEQLFKDYIMDLKSMQVYEKHEVNIAERLCNKILLSIKNAYEGRQDRAYINLDGILDEVKPYLMFTWLTSSISRPFFRIRKGNNNEFKNENMFHIPFDSRHLINSYRYSIPGHPSLYLGSSSYVCWNELRRPNFDEVQISSFTINRKSEMSILDFGLRPQDIKYYEENKESVYFEGIGYRELNRHKGKMYKDYVMMWPLIASCSIRVKHDMGTFRPEYIIPQLLCQWVRKDKEVFGIRYFSVSTVYEHHECIDHNPIDLIHNYVFPSRTFKVSGYCPEITKHFCMSKPVIWGLCDSFNTTGILDRTLRLDKIEIMKDIFVPYKETKFSTIEKVLLSRHHEPITFT